MEKEIDLSNLTIYLDPGHGDLVNGNYRTFPQDGKFYHFTENGKRVFSAYEGQTNRIFARLIETELRKLGADVVNVYHPTNDTTNIQRANLANLDYQRKVFADKTRKRKYLLLSIHSNAFSNSFEGIGTNANGIEFWTTPGHTQADVFAKLWEDELAKELKPFNIRFRGEKEENFTILFLTQMPAALVENLFFTNLREARLLLDRNYQISFTKGTIEAIKKYATQ